MEKHFGLWLNKEFVGKLFFNLPWGFWVNLKKIEVQIFSNLNIKKNQVQKFRHIEYLFVKINNESFQSLEKQTVSLEA